MAFGQPRVARGIDVIEEEGATSLNRLDCDGVVNLAGGAKRFGLLAVGFGGDERAVRSAAPEIGAAGVKESPRQRAEGPYELAGIAALECGTGKL